MSGAGQISSMSNKLQKVSAAAFGSKYASKREVYRFLSSEVNAYLPQYDSVTVWHMRDLVANRRRRIKCADIKHINVPQFEGLGIK